jgi:hypothetical protein
MEQSLSSEATRSSASQKNSLHFYEILIFITTFIKAQFGEH